MSNLDLRVSQHPQLDFPDEDELETGKLLCGMAEIHPSTLTKFIHVELQPNHAWKMLYLVWRDSISETNNLGDTPFKMFYAQKDSSMLYNAIHPETGKSLGFIRYSSRLGSVQLVIYNNPTLGGKILREGSRSSCIAMICAGYLTTLAVSSAICRFDIPTMDKPNGGHLVCYINKLTDDRIQEIRARVPDQSQSTLENPTEPRIWTDWSMEIGGGSLQPRKIREERFKTWTKHCLTLDPPTTMIETEHGSIILDEAFRNRLYVDGTLLRRGPKAKPLRFGYAIAQNQVERTNGQAARSSMAVLSPLGHKTIASIWAESVNHVGIDIVDEFLAMLHSPNEWADVQSAEENISEKAAMKLWKRLRARNRDHTKFFYYEPKGEKDSELIVNSLRKVPTPLSKTTWASLRKYSLLRTPQEQRYHLLFKAPVSSLNATRYSEGITNALKAALAVDPKTSKFVIGFKCGMQTDLNVMILHGSRLLINDKWLDFSSSHATLGCQLYHKDSQEELGNETFSCDHVVTELYNLIILEMKNAEDKESRLHLKLDENIRQMPRKEQSESESDWRLHGIKREGQVVLHRESTCASKKSMRMFVSPSLSETDFPPGCECPKKDVAMKDTWVSFHDLDPEEEYFPMISVKVHGSLYGLPPTSIRPRAPQVDPSRSIPASSDDSSPELTNPRFECSGNDDHDVPHGDDEDMQVGNFDHEDPISFFPQSDSLAARPDQSSQTPLSRTKSLVDPDQLQKVRDELRDTIKERDSLKTRVQDEEMYKAELSMARESNKALSTQLAEKDLLINELVFKVPESQANESELNKLRGQLKEALSAQSRLEEEIFEVKAQNNDLDEFADRAFELQKAAEANYENSQARSRARKEKIVEQANQLDKANSEIQILRGDLEKARTNLREKDAEIQLAASTSKGLCHHVVTNAESAISDVNEQHPIKIEELRKGQSKVNALLEENDLLVVQARDARDECATMVSTLRNVLGLVQGVLRMSPGLTIKTNLQDIVNMLQGRLGFVNGVKRERDGEGGGAGAAKRARTADAIEID